MRGASVADLVRLNLAHEQSVTHATTGAHLSPNTLRPRIKPIWPDRDPLRLTKLDKWYNKG